MRSKSVGSIYLQSDDPRMAPIIDPNYMDKDRDFVEFRRAIRLSRELFAQKAFDEFRGEELAPGSDCIHDSQVYYWQIYNKMSTFEFLKKQ